MPTKQDTSRHGFTLMEISIVIGIIAMITAGILTGQALTKNAAIRQAVNMHTQLQSAWNSFRTIYNAIPGDMPNATEYWDVDDSCPTLTPGTASTTGTCNGNGDGHVIWYNYDQFIANGWSALSAGQLTVGVSGVPGEAQLVWQHLKLSNLLNLPYYLDSDYSSANAEMNRYVIPAFRRQSRAVWFIGSNRVDRADLYSNSLGVVPNASDMIGNAVQTGIFNTAALSAQPKVAVATPAMVQAMDRKMDDGYPRSGKFQASNALSYGTSTFIDCLIDDGSGSLYIYDVSRTDDACRFLMSLDQ